MSTRRTRGGRNVGGKHGSMTHIVLAGSPESDERLACSVSDVDTVTAVGKSETSVGRRSSDEDDDEDDASCEWFSGFSVGERDRRSTFADRSPGAAVYSFVCASTVEDRLGIPRICAHSGRTTCSELAQILYT